MAVRGCPSFDEWAMLSSFTFVDTFAEALTPLGADRETTMTFLDTEVKLIQQQMIDVNLIQEQMLKLIEVDVSVQPVEPVKEEKKRRHIFDFHHDDPGLIERCAKATRMTL